MNQKSSATIAATTTQKSAAPTPTTPITAAAAQAPTAKPPKGSKPSARPKAVSKPKASGPKTAPAAKAKKSLSTKARPMSGLDAAAKVLAETGKPMRCADIMEKIKARGLWKTKGKTPEATINAAMIREIRDKRSESRFRKAGRGLFAAGKRHV